MPSPSHRHVDVAIVGGGVIGLSIAWELAQRHLCVSVLEQGPMGKAASWAGAGILPPPPGARADHPLDALARRSRELHPMWAQRLIELTGIDNGYHVCGGLYLAQTPGEMASLIANQANWTDEGLQVQEWSNDQIIAKEPHLISAVEAGRVKKAFWMAEEAQLRNPHHLKALEAACQCSNVQLRPHSPVTHLERTGRQWSLRTDQDQLSAEKVCLAAGAWTALLTKSVGFEPSVVPVRGQMRLYKTDSSFLSSILNEGPRYLVPRKDGLILAGSTEEDAGFDDSTTPDGLQSLQAFSEKWLPSLTPERCVRSWAGLRPGSVDGFPFMGPVPDREGLFVAAGHFRNGLYLSTGSAELMADLITDQIPSIEPTPFQIQRGLHLDPHS